MRLITKPIQSVILSVFLMSTYLPNKACAGYEIGLSAAKKGDYDTAVKEWLLLTEKGDPDAPQVRHFLHASG